MTPRPIHHWKTFWLGLLILAFLTWSWSRSRSHEDIVSLRPGTKAWYTFASSAGCFRCSSTTLHAPGPHSAPFFDHFSGPNEDTSPWFLPPFTGSHFEDKFSTVTFYAIAHWLIVLTFLLISSTLLLWRRKKIDHLTEATSAKPFS